MWVVCSACLGAVTVAFLMIVHLKGRLEDALERERYERKRRVVAEDQLCELIDREVGPQLARNRRRVSEWADRFDKAARDDDHGPN